jgi:cytochrome c-type biogenesis protein CcmH/NrfG
VARGTQHRKRRPAQNAQSAATVAAPRKHKPPQWQEELFFARLRNHAKWAYVTLAVAFVLGFVLLGVGSGSTGLSDMFQNAFNFGSSSSSTSISGLQHKVDKQPQNAAAWRDLATAYEAKQRPQDAVNALERYTALRPKDSDALAELASQYTTLSQTYATDYQTAQAEAAAASPSSATAPAPNTVFGKIFNDPKGLLDPIGSVGFAAASSKAQTAYAGYQSSMSSAEATFKRLAKLTPKDVTVQYQLGQAATAAGDYKGAAKAYVTFLKLSPTDVDAPQVKKLLKAVRAQAAATASQSAGR